MLPAVITVVKDINNPRLPSLRGMTKAKSAQIPTWTAQDIDVETEDAGLAGSVTQVVKVFFPQRVQRGEVLSGDLSGQTDYVVDKLRDAGII